MALIRIVSDSRSINSVPVTLLFVFIYSVQFGGGGEFSAQARSESSLDARRLSETRGESIAYFLSNRSKLRRTCLFIVCASRDLTCEAGVAAHHTHTHRQSSENIFARILFKISTRRDSPLHAGPGALS
jgi:hypothetical protein